MTAWPGWSSDDTLVLPLDDAPPGTPCTLDGREFAPKQELHVTLVGRELGAALRAALGDRLDAATRPAFEALDWSLARGGPRVLIEKPRRGDDGTPGTVASVIELVELPALDFFYHWLGQLLGRELAVPPAHVTLYTHRKAGGIGIPNLRSLRAWSRGEVDVD